VAFAFFINELNFRAFPHLFVAFIISDVF